MSERDLEIDLLRNKRDLLTLAYRRWLGLLLKQCLRRVGCMQRRGEERNVGRESAWRWFVSCLVRASTKMFFGGKTSKIANATFR